MTWISEKDAAQMLRRTPRTLRAKAKTRTWPITFTAPEGRGFQYSKTDIDKFLISQSNKTKQS